MYKSYKWYWTWISSRINGYNIVCDLQTNASYWSLLDAVYLQLASFYMAITYLFDSFGFVVEKQDKETLHEIIKTEIVLYSLMGGQLIKGSLNLDKCIVLTTVKIQIHKRTLNGLWIPLCFKVVNTLTAMWPPAVRQYTIIARQVYFSVSF